MPPSNNAGIFEVSDQAITQQRFRNLNPSAGNGSQFPSAKWGAVLLVASVIAIAVSSYLAYVSLTASKIAGCGGGQIFDCGHVTSSHWSSWMGIPVSLLAIGVYVGLIGSLLVGMSNRFSDSVRRMGWSLTSVFAIAAGLSAVWFVSLQIFVLNHLCTYCLLAHACGLIVASVVVWQRSAGAIGMKAVTSLSLSGVAILVVGQFVSETPKPYEIEQFEAPVAGEVEVFEFEAPIAPAATSVPEVSIQLPSTFQLKQAIATALLPATALTLQVAQPASQTQTEQQAEQKTEQKTKTDATKEEDKPAKRRMVAINRGTVKLDVSQWPVSGSKSAKYIFVEMFDYSCPNCRKTHATIKAANKKLSGELAVVVLPVPLNASCNNTIKVANPAFAESCEISKLAVAVWRVDPAKFTKFHNWMFASEKAPTYKMAKAQAEKMVNAEKLNKEIASDVPSKYIAKTVELYKRDGSQKVPKLIFPTTSVVGEFTSVEELVRIIKEQNK